MKLLNQILVPTIERAKISKKNILLSSLANIAKDDNKYENRYLLVHIT